MVFYTRVCYQLKQPHPHVFAQVAFPAKKAVVAVVAGSEGTKLSERSCDHVGKFFRLAGILGVKLFTSAGCDYFVNGYSYHVDNNDRVQPGVFAGSLCERCACRLHNWFDMVADNAWSGRER